MPFNQFRGAALASLCMAGVLCVALLVTGCSERVTEENDVLVAAKERVAANVLGEIGEESADVLRNLTNLLAALPEICATPVAALGRRDAAQSFSSSLLGPPDAVRLVGEDDEDTGERIYFGSWNLSWRGVALGGAGVPPTETVDITLNVRLRSSGQGTLRAVPFTLIPQSALLATATADQPPFLEDTAAFYLSQDATTGVWTLRWRTPRTTKVFDGSISGSSLSRVIRRVADAAGQPGDVVESLEVGTSAAVINFRETTTPGEEKGFTFFSRPGALLRFKLRIGDTEDDLEPITADQLRIGGDGVQLPASEDPEEFRLATNLPFDPTGPPTFSAGAELGTFVWHDVEQNTCNAGQEQWRVRFSTAGERTTFSGNVTVLEDDEFAALTFTTIGTCQGELKNGDKTLDYTCTLAGDQVGGYDVCTTAGRRVAFIPAVNDLEDPGLVFVGAERQLPPSPDPFSIVFDIDLTEAQTSRNLTLADAQVVLSGNSDLDGVLRLNPDQLSLEPLCGRLPLEIERIIRPQVAATFGADERLVQPRVRFTGSGDYSTSRFDGSLYLLQEVEFLNPAVHTLDDALRFPKRGRIVLHTRLQDEVENTVITAEAKDIAEDEAGHVTQPVKIEINLSRVIFEFQYDPTDPQACPECLMDLTLE